MKPKYPVLQWAATILKVLAVIITCSGIGVGVALTMFGKSEGLFVILGGIIYGLVLRIAADLIFLLIDVEQNTRATRSLLERQQSSDFPPHGPDEK